MGDKSQGSLGYNFIVFLILLITLLFANFAESLAEARGKAQADSLRKTREETPAKLKDGRTISSSQLQKGDVFICVVGDIIASDGEIIEGLATIDESAITGESAPVIREAGGDRSSVTGGTKVLSDEITVLVTATAGESFLDKMIALVEGAKRQKTPNEIALTILLAGFTLVFILVCVTLKPFADYSNVPISIAAFISLFVCLIPTTIGGLLSAIGIAGMDRALRANVLTKSGRAVETAGDVDVLLLDKTGTITIGNRKATNFHPAPGVDQVDLIRAATLSSLYDETPEGKSIVELAGLDVTPFKSEEAKFIKFTAETRCSGVDMSNQRIRKGATDSIKKLVEDAGHTFPNEVVGIVEQISGNGGTPLVVSENEIPLGVVELQDIVKPGIQERFERLRKMGIKTVMVTGDNPLTAGYIAKKAGVDDFIAEAKPEDKMNYIRKEQGEGKLVAMMGDGTNDAPALAQADVGVAMNSGTQAAKEAGNMVDLDNDPTKLIEVVEIGKQLLMTRGTLTTFSIANDVAKYFAIIPALFVAFIPALAPLNIMDLKSPESAILSAIIFNAVLIPMLIPLALKGVAYKPIGASALLRRNILIYGFGGLIVPFIGIKLIDVLLSVFI
jgi:K+-transporting ATPase ATPase B chain